MSASVLIAEVCVATLLHKLHKCMECTTLSYVDDINILVANSDLLDKAIRSVLDFIQAFRLELSVLKTVVWGGRPRLLFSLSCDTWFFDGHECDIPGCGLACYAWMPTNT